MKNKWIDINQDTSVLIRLPYTAFNNIHDHIHMPKKDHKLYRVKVNDDLIVFTAGITDHLIINVCISIVRCVVWIDLKYQGEYYTNIQLSESKCFTILSNIVKPSNNNKKGYDIKLLCGLYNAILESDSYWCVQHFEAITNLLNRPLYDLPIVKLFINEIGKTAYCWPNFFGINEYLILDENKKRIKTPWPTKDEDCLWMIMQTILQNKKLSRQNMHIMKLYDLLNKNDLSIKVISDENILLILDTQNTISPLYIYKKIRGIWCALWPSYQQLYNEVKPQVKQLVKTAAAAAKLENDHDLADKWLTMFYNTTSRLSKDHSIYCDV